MYIFLAVVVLLFLAWVFWGYFSVKNVETLSYKVLDDSKEYEIREYEDYIVAETEIEGGFSMASNKSFSILAGYIFGGNESKEKIAMTAPVLIDEESTLRTFSFVMPKKYTLESLPKPIDSRVKIRKISGKKVAAIRFRGIFSNNLFEKKKEELKKYLERDGIKYTNITSAGYNPPWTPPFMTRNEAWAIIKE
ncbi:heme-binding protein [Candidatus Peregrinibacteria bacterium CG10_big_fil_rev_8_21_14_0_10_36_19]|nr:MAG: heme-binding protein [Candidatus Peregrinibacteria bacterium CG10_big_fil_rev_8_21_14_0_10_36_19]